MAHKRNLEPVVPQGLSDAERKVDYFSVYALWAAIASSVAAIASAIAAFRSLSLMKSIQRDAKADERIVIGGLTHPRLVNPDHANSVLAMPLFNRSRRNVVIADLTVLDGSGREIVVTWGLNIDHLGNVQQPLSRAVVTEKETIFIRRNDGEHFIFCRVSVRDSFSEQLSSVVLDPASEYWEKN